MPWFAEPIPRRATPLVAVGVEAVVDDVFFETDDGFHADCDVFETDWIDNASAFCNEGVNTFCVDDEIAFEGFFANGNTAYAAILADEAVYASAADNETASFFNFTSEPLIEFFTQHAVGLVAQRVGPWYR